MNNVGKIVQIIGPVLDIRFEDGELPNILNAIEIDNKGQRLVAEVAQHIGDNVVRCISMGSTDGLVRGMDAVDTGEGIKVPVGEETLGRIFNVLGDAVDNMPNPETKEKWCIHREPPTKNKIRQRKYLKRVLRLSTLLRRMQKAVKSVFSAVQVSARLFL